MSKNLYEELDIIKAVRSESNQQTEALAAFYQDAKNLFVMFIQRNNGTKDDAEDIFQEGMQHFILNIRSGIFQQKSSPKTYLFRICRNLWLSKLRRKNKWKNIQQILTQEKKEQVYHPVILEKKERRVLLDRALSSISDACKEVLSYWSQGYSMKEIAQMTIYKNEQGVMKKKSICLKSLVTKVKNQPDLMKELLNHL